MTALGEPRQAVVGERFPHRGVGDELPHRGTNARIGIERPHADADRLGVARVRAEHRRPAVAAKPLLAAAVRRPPHAQLLPTGDDAEAAWSRVRLRRGRSARSPLAPLAVAIARAEERLGDLVPNRSTVTTA